MKKSNPATYLFYIALALLFILSAAFVQMTYVYETYNPKLFVIPTIVGSVFGALIAKVRILQKDQRGVLARLEEKEREIVELNGSLEKKVQAKTHELSEQRLYSESILNAQNSIVIITDGYSIIQANRTFFEYFDDFITLEDFTNTHKCICDMFSKKEGYLQPDMDSARWTTYMLENPGVNHRSYIRFHGKEFYFQVHARQFLFNASHKIIVTFEDITELVRYEEELQHKIDDEIEANRQKDAIIHEQTRFTAIGEALQSVSHHWRQPLSALSLMIQDVREAREFNELNNKYFDDFVAKSLTLIQDMSDTLDAFKFIFSKEVQEKREFALEDAVNRSLSIVRPNLKALGIELITQTRHPKVIINASLTEYMQVLLSILSNAVDALKQKEGDKQIMITVDQDENGKSQLAVFNNGDTIKTEHLDKIFDPYFSTKFEKNGTGLGLFVTKNILENRMNGTITVHNLPKGVEFLITV